MRPLQASLAAAAAPDTNPASVTTGSLLTLVTTGHPGNSPGYRSAFYELACMTRQHDICNSHGSSWFLCSEQAHEQTAACAGAHTEVVCHASRPVCDSPVSDTLEFATPKRLQVLQIHQPLVMQLTARANVHLPKHGALPRGARSSRHAQQRPRSAHSVGLPSASSVCGWMMGCGASAASTSARSQ